jgi:hypothetical protein
MYFSHRPLCGGGYAAPHSCAGSTAIVVHFSYACHCHAEHWSSLDAGVCLWTPNQACLWELQDATTDKVTKGHGRNFRIWKRRRHQTCTFACPRKPRWIVCWPISSQLGLFDGCAGSGPWGDDHALGAVHISFIDQLHPQSPRSCFAILARKHTRFWNLMPCFLAASNHPRLSFLSFLIRNGPSKITEPFSQKKKKITEAVIIYMTIPQFSSKPDDTQYKKRLLNRQLYIYI